MTKVLRLLQVDQLTWSTISYQELPGRVLTVLFAYGIMAWNRFGLLGVTAPRAPIRLVLIGIYSWLALAAIFWLTARMSAPGSIPPKDAAVAASVVHIPLVALGFFMAIVAGFARILGPGTVLAVVVVGLWMPALVARAMRDVAGLRWSRAVPFAALIQLGWVVGTGRHLHAQVGHLL